MNMLYYRTHKREFYATVFLIVDENDRPMLFDGASLVYAKRRKLAKAPTEYYSERQANAFIIDHQEFCKSKGLPDSKKYFLMPIYIP